ncbi:SusC/RagA family TonB-linked outer membrane protein [Fodinibius sp. AD559]|uniref:SusC/RagA family TonB-linked outer membrane protein n=1 Tax=Fodinibius sp. AD559 TaxID=3424179 RepID=UPI004046C417
MIPIKKLLITSCLVLGLTLPGLAQSSVSGTVTDAQSGETLPGVNITVKNMPERGTATNANGTYNLNVPSLQDTLVYSFVGFVKQEVPINGRTTIDVSLSPDVQQLEDVVVIGYGTQQREDQTGSITSVSSEDFNEGAITSAQELFQGKASGVSVTSGDGAPGSGATIRIRGGSSLTASNDPLYVIDGVPLDGGGVAGMRNPLNTINPNDIESITILKDASATAIYGSRASNGVVLIETKTAEQGQDLQVSYTGKASYQTIPKMLDVYSADEFRNIIEQQHGQNAVDLLGDTNTKWQDQIYNPAFSQDHNLSLAGSTGFLPYRVSLGFSDNSGILKTSDMERLTGSVTLNPSFFDDNLEVNLNLKGMRVDNFFANRGAIGSAVYFDPTQPVMVGNEDDPWGGYYTWTNSQGNPIPIAPANPVAMLEQQNDISTIYRSIGKLKLDYTPDFFSNITATLNLGYDYSDTGEGQVRVQENAAFQYDGSGIGGLWTDYNQRKENELLDFYIKYQNDFPSIESSVDFTAGYSWEHHLEESSNFSTNRLRQDTTVVYSDTDFATENYLLSTFGRLNYSYKDKYLLTGTIRYDGTSRFSEDNRWGLFPSLALAWKVHEEPFLSEFEKLSQLKLRLGYGVTGQQRINQGDYPYLGTYTQSQPTASYLFGNEFVQTLRPEGYNQNLKWEETTTYNIGMDYGFFDGRLNGSLEGYYRKTTDLLNVVTPPAGTNLTNSILSNIGSLEVKGLEFSVTSIPLSTEDSYWEVSFNATHSVNEITKLTAGDNPGYEGVRHGGISIGNTIQVHSVGYPRSSFYVYEQVYDENGDPIEGVYVDRNNDGVINSSDLYRYQSPDSDVSFGFSSRYEYKNWDASFSARAEIGNYVFNNVAAGASYIGLYNSTGYLSNTTTQLEDTEFWSSRFLSDHFVENASFLRMDNITVGYTFSQLPDVVKSMRLAATVQNAFVISNYDGLDPEIFGGIDGNIYPRPRTFVLSASLNF